jgi:flagellar biosynthesis/type III secretory pathway protein FliH
VLNLWSVDDDNIVKEPEDLYYWAKLFKAETWEELKMIAEKNSYMEDAIVTYHEMTEDEKVREQCEAREKYYWDRASIYNKGKNEGLVEGMEIGKNEGLAEGMEIGRNEGLSKGMEIGKNKGLSEGVAIGEQQTRDRLQSLISVLVKDNRMEDIKLIGDDSNYLNQLLVEYKL